jgi:5,10-methylenetetrahydrofolate reductase
MKIGQTIQEKGKSLSFEFFPPKDQSGDEYVYNVLGSVKAWVAAGFPVIID